MTKKTYKPRSAPSKKREFLSLLKRYEALGKAEKVAFREKVQSATLWSYDTFYRKLNLTELINPLERHFIAEHLLNCKVEQVFKPIAKP